MIFSISTHHFFRIPISCLLKALFSQQVRSFQKRPDQRCFKPPVLNFFVVSPTTEFREHHVLQRFWDGYIVHILKHCLKRNLVQQIPRPPSTPGNQSGYCIDNHHGSQLASGKDIITDGNFIIDEIKTNSFIDTFVTTADENKSIR